MAFVQPIQLDRPKPHNLLSYQDTAILWFDKRLWYFPPFAVRDRHNGHFQDIRMLLAVSAHMLQIAGMYVHGYGVQSGGFWTHCSAVALLSENIAKRSSPLKRPVK